MAALVDRFVVRVQPGFRVTIPAALRRALGIKAGDQVDVRWQEGVLFVRKATPDQLAMPREGTTP